MLNDDHFLICTTCGHVDGRIILLETMKTLDNTPCERPWCDGNYALIDLREQLASDRRSSEAIKQYIKDNFFQLPTFDREAYMNECLLRDKARKENEEWRATHPIERCPKCGSSAIEKKRRGFKVGRALMGGYLAGSIGADDLVNKCKVCRCEWRP